MQTNYERANHGPKENQDTRVAHQMRQVELREKRKRARKNKEQ
jgi:hypothetical protein